MFSVNLRIPLFYFYFLRQVVFCSRQCAAADQYHKYECDVLSLILEDSVPRLAFRIVLSGLAVISSPDSLKKARQTLFELEGHSNKRKDLLGQALKAVFLTKCMMTCVPSEHMDLVPVGTEFLTLLLSLPTNACHTYILELDGGEMEMVGSAVSSVLSLVNHSCEPNMMRNEVGEKTVMRALRSLKIGEELTISYGPLYSIMARAERRRQLAGQFFFHCECRACKEDWPLCEKLKVLDRKFAVEMRSTSAIAKKGKKPSAKYEGDFQEMASGSGGEEEGEDAVLGLSVLPGEVEGLL